ncbi:hypothetical protein OEZ85_003624 [Tetradesmus obliquus]|uniref:Protein transport protein SEC23 n=1 Tax=Tetradesmus obliquus TaxID=3088 RepID=A0ABY8UC69_TETOB|nr:hypothetical protein OEZ85_003624 [Tetradesmus obliquus]
MGDMQAAADWSQPEETDGIRLTWNLWPNSKLEATKCVIPFAAMYTPNKRLPNMPVLPYEPVPCKQCGAILNPYASVDYYAKIWVCPICYTRCHFPPHYQGISEQNVPAELFPQYTTVEYTLNRTVPPHPPTYLFVVDTAVAEDELHACKTAITQVLQMIPEESHVGLITFGMHVHVHELGFSECSKAFVFRGSKEYTSAQVVDQLGLRPTAPRPGAPVQQGGSGRQFILPLADTNCDTSINNVLGDLQRDAYPVSSDQRPARCTGIAMQVAEALMSASVPPGSCMARIMLFTGGPCTEGLGKVIGRDLTEEIRSSLRIDYMLVMGLGKVIGRDLTKEIRSHKDLAKDAAPHFRKAKKFYDGLAAEMVGHGHICDVFSCALDNTGLFEQKEMVQLTGGQCVLIDTFHNVVFKESLKRMFAKEGEEGFLGMCSHATLEVLPSRDIKISGVLGHAARSEKKSSSVADTEVGLGGTSQWKLCGLDADTTLGVLFEITGSGAGLQEQGQAPQLFLQFITRYMHWSGQMRCRVTTLTRYWTDGSNSADLINGFDQETAAGLMARLATFKMENEDDFDPTRFLDRSLIRLCQRFAEYRKDDPASFMLHSNLQYFPQFMFNLRRSQFVQVFGFGPDETAFFRLTLFKVPVLDAVAMFQPQLVSYSFQGVEPALLDVSSILPERILLLDAFFYVVVFHGTTVAQWRKERYQDNPEHEAFKQLLAAPQEEAKTIARRRFPVPKIVDCDQNGSQARFLLAKLNPSATYNTSTPMSSEVIMTDDVSLQVFTEHLKRLAVQS